MINVVGCGIDIEEPVRFEKYLKNLDEIPLIIKDLFTSEEIKRNLTDNIILRFTLGFACKEALFKSFGLSWVNSKIFWQDIELIFKKKNASDFYSIKLNNYALEVYKKLNCKKIVSSILINTNYVIFKAILLR